MTDNISPDEKQIAPVVEAVARGIASHYQHRVDDEYRDIAVGAISAYTAALKEQGFVIVPIKPTEAMEKAVRETTPFGGEYADWRPGQIVSNSVYRNMIQAAQEDTSHD